MNHFLAYRCDKEFLASFIERMPDFIPTLEVGSYLYAVSDVDVIIRLDQVGLLSELERARHVTRIRELAVDTPDSGFLSTNISGFLSPEELNDILRHVRSSLLPNLDFHIDNWRDNYDVDKEDPDRYFSLLKSTLSDYLDAFSADENALSRIERGLSCIDETIEELCSEMPEEPDSGDYYSERSHRGESGGSRSIFDDVDR